MNAHITAMKAMLLAVMLTGAITAEAAGDAAAGAAKAKGCATCHGADGKGRIPLAGKKAGYLAEQMRAFRSGVRKEQTMNMMTQSLSDQDIEDLAAYFTSK